MKTIILTKGYSTIVDDDIYEWAKEFNWLYTNGYAVRMGKQSDGRRNRKFVYLHKEILVFKFGYKDLEGDHIDRNRLNNLTVNLRWCTSRENSCNIALKIGKSKYKGVRTGKKGKWDAAVSNYGKSIYIGRFTTEAEAAKAYDKAALKYQKEFAYLNFPDLKNDYLYELLKDQEKEKERLELININILKLLSLQNKEKEKQIGI